MAYGWCFLFFLKIVIRDVALSSTPSNVTIDKRNFNAFPVIHDGEPCVPGRTYKMECNICKCNSNFSLVCSKMGCVHWKKPIYLNKSRKALRQESKPLEKPHYLPEVQSGVSCKPGKLYRSGCRRCFCTDESRIVCSKKEEACKLDKNGYPLSSISSPEDVSPPLPLSLAQKLQVVSSASEKCEPGKSYMVDCNTCICMESFNLLCTKLLCISYEDMHRIEAEDMSDKPCLDGESTKTNCMKCDCVNSKTDCHQIPNCRFHVQQLAGREQLKSKLNPRIDKTCHPGTVYKMDCNTCHCQSYGSLRCTKKFCLNYSQVVMLDKQRLYLEKHGL